MKEIWKPIYNDYYAVSNLGRVRRLKPALGTSVGRILKPHPDKYGYLQLTICVNRKRFYKHIHNLAAEAFIGQRPSNKEVNHIDGNILNNTIENLEYITPIENQKHKIRIGHSTYGEKNKHAKLTQEQVGRILKDSKLKSVKAWAQEFNVSPDTIWRIIRGTTWKHLHDKRRINVI